MKALVFTMIKLIKFFIVGGINTLISLIVFYLLNKVLGVNHMISSVIGYASGMANSYILNKKWTFKNNDNKILIQLMKFIAVNGISLGVNLFAMYMLVDLSHFDSMLSQIIATAFSTITNYIGSRLIVFNSISKNAA